MTSATAPRPFVRSRSRREFFAAVAAAAGGAAAFGPLAAFAEATGQPATASSGTGETTAPTAAECFALRENGGRIPVILDTDLGDDIDDTWALLYLLKCPELDVRLISCETPRSVYRAKIVAKFLEAVGRTDIPIAVDRKGSNDGGRQSDWVADYDLESYSGTLIDGPAEAMVEAINTSEQPLTVVAIGPVPEVARAVRLDPWIGRKARFVGMHGSIYKGYVQADDPNEPTNEYNVKVDPAALRTVLEAEWEPTLTPLDTCGRLRLAGDRYRQVRESNSPGVAELMANYDVWLPNAKWVGKIDPEQQSTILFDIVAITLAFSEEWCQMETLPLEVDDEGYTRINRQDGRPTRLALEWRDLDAYEQHVVDRLTSDIAPAV